jgi:hypothetical protein
MLDRATDVEAAEPSWKSLYTVGGVAALIAVVVFRRNLGAEVSLLSGQIPPNSVGDWFTLLQNDRLLGLAFLKLFDLANYALVGLVFLALYPALRRVNASIMTITVASGFIGIAVYFASNQAISMLTLSDQYAAATTDAQRAMFLAAGEAMLATVYQGTGDSLSLFLVTLAGLMISIVMLRSEIFSRVTAYLGILAHVLVLGYFVTLVVAPALTFVPHSAAAVPLIIWELLIARRLFQLAKGEP